MGHGPATEWKEDKASSVKSRMGTILFFVYMFVYAAFVAIAVMSPNTMEMVIGGQTLAVVYGMGLIVLALIMGVMYNSYCTKAEDRLNK